MTCPHCNEGDRETACVFCGDEMCGKCADVMDEIWECPMVHWKRRAEQWAKATLEGRTRIMNAWGDR